MMLFYGILYSVVLYCIVDLRRVQYSILNVFYFSICVVSLLLTLVHPNSSLYLTLLGELNMSDSCSSMLAATSPLRHQVLQSYVRQLAILLENTPFLGSLFTFLELTPSVPY